MSTTLKGKCAACGHIFVVAHLPLELSKVALLVKRAACPVCAGTRIFVATDDETSASEPPEENPEITRRA